MYNMYVNYVCKLSIYTMDTYVYVGILCICILCIHTVYVY